MRHPWLVVVLSFDVSCRDDLHQVLVAVVVLGKQDEVIIASVILVLEPVIIMPGDIYLASDDRLDLRELLGYLEKLLHTIHVSMVCNGQCRHSELFRSSKKT